MRLLAVIGAVTPPGRLDAAVRLAAVRERIGTLRAVATRHGRDPGDLRFSVSLRPIIAPTEEQAWAKARAILERVRAKQGDRTLPLPEAVGARRLVDFAQQSEVHDKRLWTPIAAAKSLTSYVRLSRSSRDFGGMKPTVRCTKVAGGPGEAYI